MSKNNYDIPDNLIGNAWQVFTKNAFWAVSATFLYLLYSFIPNIINVAFSTNSSVETSIVASLFSFAISVAMFFATPVFVIWIYNLVTVMIEQKDLNAIQTRSQVFGIRSGAYWNILLYYFLIGLAAFGIIFVIGVILFISAALTVGSIDSTSSGLIASLLFGLFFITLFFGLLYIAIRLSQTEYLIIDKKYGVIKALQSSFAITKGKFWSLFAYGMLFVGIAILGILALGVGILVAYPIILISHVLIYRALRQKLDSHTQPDEQTQNPVEPIQ